MTVCSACLPVSVSAAALCRAGSAVSGSRRSRFSALLLSLILHGLVAAAAWWHSSSAPAGEGPPMVTVLELTREDAPAAPAAADPPPAPAAADPPAASLPPEPASPLPPLLRSGAPPSGPAAHRPLPHPATPPSAISRPAMANSAPARSAPAEGSADAEHPSVAEPAVRTGDTAPAASPASTGPEQSVRRAGQPDPVADYLHLVRARIAAAPLPRMRRLTSPADVEFIIAVDGSLQGLTLCASSGSVLLDAAALQAVTLAAPFPPPPVSMSEAQRHFTLSFRPAEQP